MNFGAYFLTKERTYENFKKKVARTDTVEQWGKQ